MFADPDLGGTDGAADSLADRVGGGNIASRSRRLCLPKRNSVVLDNAVLDATFELESTDMHVPLVQPSQLRTTAEGIEPAVTTRLPLPPNVREAWEAKMAKMRTQFVSVALAEWREDFPGIDSETSAEWAEELAEVLEDFEVERMAREKLGANGSFPG